MATFSTLPSGKTRVQIRRGAFYRAATFSKKSDARAWATEVEAAAESAVRGGLAAPPKDASLEDLIDKYIELVPNNWGRSKSASLALLKRELGTVRLGTLNSHHLRDFVDKLQKGGAGGVTIAGYLSTLSAVLGWGRHARQLDVDPRLATDARRSLKHRGLNTRSVERDREPTDEELQRLYAHWATKPRQKIPMETIVKFKLATSMRISEVTRLQVEDVNRERRTVIIHDRKDPKNKLGNDQEVPLLDDAWALIEPLLVDRTEGQLFLGVDPRSVSASFTRACVALKINNLHLHDNRHRATAELFRKGLDIPEVAMLTGHKTWAMLKRYTRIRPEDVRAKVANATAQAKRARGAKL
jgi:integrase